MKILTPPRAGFCEHCGTPREAVQGLRGQECLYLCVCPEQEQQRLTQERERGWVTAHHTRIEIQGCSDIPRARELFHTMEALEMALAQLQLASSRVDASEASRAQINLIQETRAQMELLGCNLHREQLRSETS